MDLQEQLKKLFPEHETSNSANTADNQENKTKHTQNNIGTLWIPDTPIQCVYEKRKGKPTTIIRGYTGSNADFKLLAKLIKKEFHVGGSYKNEALVFQGNYRDSIMQFLKDIGFIVKRVGG